MPAATSGSTAAVTPALLWPHAGGQLSLRHQGYRNNGSWLCACRRVDVSRRSEALNQAPGNIPVQCDKIICKMLWQCFAESQSATGGLTEKILDYIILLLGYSDSHAQLLPGQLPTFVKWSWLWWDIPSSINESFSKPQALIKWSNATNSHLGSAWILSYAFRLRRWAWWKGKAVGHPDNGNLEGHGRFRWRKTRAQLYY